MDIDNQSRRAFFKVALAGAASSSGIATATIPAEAYQGNMERSLFALNNALMFLRRATPDKGGHRETAIGLIEQAMGEVQAGINYAAQRFGD